MKKNSGNSNLAYKHQLYDILICPECGYRLKLSENSIPFCEKCSYKIEKIALPIDNDLKVYKKFFDIAIELTKGYAVNRSFMHSCIKKIINIEKGKVLDIGAGKNPSYIKYLKKFNIDYYKADGDIKNNPDIVINIESQLPFLSNSFDSVLLFNVLEHIYNFKNALKNINKILKKDGTLYLFVPYLIKIHGSPSDYFRYTNFSLSKVLKDTGFYDIKIYTDGGFMKILSELFNWLSKPKIGYILFPLYLAFSFIDFLIGVISRFDYQKSYPLGYFVVCRKK